MGTLDIASRIPRFNMPPQRLEAILLLDVQQRCWDGDVHCIAPSMGLRGAGVLGQVLRPVEKFK
jgi:hypothetical protein